MTSKNILIGVTGGIAAYKVAYLVRGLVKNGHNVKVIMTREATEFITPLTLSVLSKNRVYTELSEPDHTWNSHVELGLWADVFVIAPSTANTLAKMACGIADNLLLTTYLSARCPIVVAPAMDLDMWEHYTTQDNLQKLEENGVHIVPVEVGELASGLVGKGRMAEPQTIIGFLQKILQPKNDLQGKKVLITAGPTVEEIDPVRFISNRSTGKMGIALARECLSRGADVHLVLGPVKLSPPEKAKVYNVTSAQSMAEAVFELKDKVDIFIFAAAVADYTPENVSSTKIKKSDADLSISLKRTVDIAQSIGEEKKKDQITVGFALETDSELDNAMSKLKRKNFDFIVLNSLRDKGAGFAVDTNKVTIISAKDNNVKKFELKSKGSVAIDIIDSIVSVL